MRDDVADDAGQTRGEGFVRTSGDIDEARTEVGSLRILTNQNLGHPRPAQDFSIRIVDRRGPYPMAVAIDERGTCGVLAATADVKRPTVLGTRRHGRIDRP